MHVWNFIVEFLLHMRRTEAECATKMAWLSAWNDVMAANWNCDDRVCQL